MLLTLKRLATSRVRLTASIGLGVCLTSVASPAAAADAKACISAYEAGVKAQQTGRPLEARGQFDGCLDPGCPEAIRQECASHRSKADADVPSIVVGATDGADRDIVNASVWLDGNKVADALSAKSIELAPGNHVIRIRRGDAEVEQKVLLRQGEKNRSFILKFPKVDADAAKSGGTAPPTNTDEPPTDRNSNGYGPWPYVIGGVGVVGLGAFGFFALDGQGKESDLDSCKPSCAPGDVDAMDTSYLLADISLGVGLVAISVAVYMLLDGDSNSVEQRMNSFPGRLRFTF